MKDRSISDTGPQMRHEQVAMALSSDIAQLPEGAQIPTEPDLMARFEVSRTTIRRAVDAMVSEGLLIRRPPKGTFVTKPPFQHALDHPGAFLDTLIGAGSVLEPHLVAFRWIDNADDVPAEVGPEALYFERFYTHDDRPCALAQVYVAAPYARRISLADIENTPSHEVFTTTLGISVERTDAAVTAVEAPADLADRLGLHTGAALITLRRWMYTFEDQLLQHSVHYLPARQFELALSQPRFASDRGAPAGPPAKLRLVSPQGHTPGP